MLNSSKVGREKVKKYARIASKAYINDPVYVYACKNVKIREKFIYNFILLRLNSSRKKDIFFFDEKNSGLLVLREAFYDYTMWQFLKCPNWVFLVLYFPVTIKTLLAYSHLDNKEIFDENTYIISPVFVDVCHWGKGAATALIKEGIEYCEKHGKKLGLETQNPANVGFYEKLGFKTVKREHYEKEDIYNFYMLYEK